MSLSIIKPSLIIVLPKRKWNKWSRETRINRGISEEKATAARVLFHPFYKMFFTEEHKDAEEFRVLRENGVIASRECESRKSPPSPYAAGVRRMCAMPYVISRAFALPPLCGGGCKVELQRLHERLRKPRLAARFVSRELSATLPSALPLPVCRRRRRQRNFPDGVRLLPTHGDDTACVAPLIIAIK